MQRSPGSRSVTCRTASGSTNCAHRASGMSCSPAGSCGTPTSIRAWSFTLFPSRSPAPGVLVVPVSEAGLDEHLGVRVAGGMPAHLAELLFSASFAADPDVAFFTVRLDGRPVGVSLAIRSGDVGGVYAVGTLPDARRRGVGTAATWACVTAGRAWGCGAIALQASDMGLPIYAAMGFRTVVEYTVFRRLAGA